MLCDWFLYTVKPAALEYVRFIVGCEYQIEVLQLTFSHVIFSLPLPEMKQTYQRVNAYSIQIFQFDATCP